ncbi:MAG: hypothetical protein F4213_18000 [Boseongicola sp. SB0677_bin_26]|nr:hypothetical protein [Boseongicola sp. SB0677_bin_26]
MGGAPTGLDGERTVDALEGDGLDVLLDVDLWRCAEARVLDESRRETVIRWRPETRMRRFPLVKDPDWGLRLHRSDLAESRQPTVDFLSTGID